EIQAFNVTGANTSTAVAQTLESGSLYAGSLQVATDASIANQLTVGGTLLVGQGGQVKGTFQVQSPTNSTAAFSVQNASGANLFKVDTTNSALVVGTGDAGTPAAVTIRGAAASGSSVAGANITFDASNGTGTAGSGALVFRTASANTST